MKNIKESQSALVNDTCTDCGSYADIGAVIDEHDTLLTVTLSGSDAQEKAQTLLQEALQALAAIPYNTQSLEEFARYVIERKN